MITEKEERKEGKDGKEKWKERERLNMSLHEGK